MTGSTPDRRISDVDIVSEKHVVEAKVLDSPPSDIDQGIVKDWDGEEASVKRK
jgi:hypothetical protein